MRRKLSLHVGINDYPGTGSDLAGCVNDAFDCHDTFLGAGYQPNVLVDAAASKAAIIDGLENLIAQATWGDRVVWTVSSHGTWRPDRNGDEADGRDEAIVCADMQLLLDDEIDAIFAKAKRGVGKLILSDSCHSGSVMRFASPGVPGEYEPVRKEARFLPPTVFSDISTERAVELEKEPASTPRMTTSLISGCADLEYSYDAWFETPAGPRPNGAFTRVALNTYRPGIRLKEWHAAIRAHLPSKRYPQSPQLTATPYRRYTRAI